MALQTGGLVQRLVCLPTTTPARSLLQYNTPLKIQTLSRHGGTHPSTGKAMMHAWDWMSVGLRGCFMSAEHWLYVCGNGVFGTLCWVGGCESSLACASSRCEVNTGSRVTLNCWCV